MANGHPNAHRYPLHTVFEEAELVRDREHRFLANQAALLQMAVSTVPNSAIKGGVNKKAVTAFSDTLKALLGD